MEQIIVETYAGATLQCKWEVIQGIVPEFKITDIENDYSELLNDCYPSNKNQLLENLSYLLNNSDKSHYESDNFSIVYYKPYFQLSCNACDYEQPEIMLTLHCHSDLARKVESFAGFHAGEPVDFDSGIQTYLLNRGGILETLLVLLNIGFSELGD